MDQYLLLSLQNSLSRTPNEYMVQSRFTEVLYRATGEAPSKKVIEDLFVLLFSTRSIRSGLGLRRASMLLWTSLLNESMTRTIALDLLDLVPEYGCWRDLFEMPYIAHTRVLDIVESQLKKDELAACDGTNTISLLAKWIPREGHPMAVECACRLIPGEMFLGTRMKLYRKRIARLNRLLDTVEIKMCSKSWSKIVPAKVPALALNKYKKAFVRHHVTLGNSVDHEVSVPISEFPEQHIRDRVQLVA